MAITTYAELVTAVQAWLMDRTDIAAYVPDLITLGEGVINFGFDAENPALNVNPLRTREMETVTSPTLTPTAGVVSLPADYLQYRRVVSTASSRRNLEYITPDAADDLYPTRSGGSPCNFTIISTELQTFPYDSNNIELTYYAKVPALTASATTNWLLTKNPGIYLRTTLMMAAEFIKDSAEMERQAFMARGMITAMNKSDFKANYARAGVTIRGVTP